MLVLSLSFHHKLREWFRSCNNKGKEEGVRNKLKIAYTELKIEPKKEGQFSAFFIVKGICLGIASYPSLS